MDFVTLARILARRWYLVLPALAMTLFVGATLVGRVEPEFEAKGSLVLYLRDDRGVQPGLEQEAPNPFATQSRALDSMAVLLDNVMSDPIFRSRVADAGFSSDYDVSVDAASPILTLTATAPTRRGAVDTASELLSQAATELAARQDAVRASPQIRIEAQVLSQPSVATKITVARNRAIVSVTVAGLIVVIGLALLAESVANSRRRARAARAARSPSRPQWSEPELALEDEDELPRRTSEPARRRRALWRRSRQRERQPSPLDERTRYEDDDRPRSPIDAG